MSWRDHPEIIWQDDDYDRIAAHGGFLSAVLTDCCGGYENGIAVAAPESLAERVEATERWLAALGLTADNIREKPRPIEAGDTVKRSSPMLWRVVHVDGDTAMIRPVSGGGGPLLAAVDDLTHADPDEPEPDSAEAEWVITRDPRVLAAAIDAGRTVQYEGVGRWVDTDAPAADFRRRSPDPLVIDYRYEGPAIEAPVNRCTSENRTCGHDEPWCGKKVAGYMGVGTATTWCSRPVGHDDDCIPCASGSDRHNLHLPLRPEDR